MQNDSFRPNFTSHILAALLAILLWSYVKTANLAPPAEVSKAFADVALEVRNVASHLQVVNELPKTVTVTVRGLPGETEAVTKESLAAYLDLSTAKAGKGQYVVSLVVPAGFSATSSPPRVEVQLEQLLSVDVSLQVLGDQVIHNQQLLVAELPVSFVRVTGIQSRAERVREAFVQTNWQQVQDGAKLSLPVMLRDVAGQEIGGLQVTPAAVEVTLHRYSGKQLPIVVASEGELPPEWQSVEFTHEPLQVTVYGPSELLDQLDAISTTAIDLSQLTEDTEQTLPLLFPEGVMAPSVEQVQVKVMLTPATEG
ncbi:MAG: YbbR-like domain-containing protein [Bacillota bacterium]|jgi:YbbR domain-containing protein